MEKIEPKYLTFEQAIWFKEKGFDVPTLTFYLDGKPMFNHNKEPRNSNILPGNIDVARPEQWQVVEWLRVNHGVWVCVDYSMDDNHFIYGIRTRKIDAFDDGYNSPQEAYSAAFDYIKDNRIF